MGGLLLGTGRGGVTTLVARHPLGVTDADGGSEPLRSKINKHICGSSWPVHETKLVGGVLGPWRYARSLVVYPRPPSHSVPPNPALRSNRVSGDVRAAGVVRAGGGCPYGPGTVPGASCNLWGAMQAVRGPRPITGAQTEGAVSRPDPWGHSVGISPVRLVGMSSVCSKSEEPMSLSLILDRASALQRRPCG